MKKYLYILAFLLLAVTAGAQQRLQYNQYVLNPYLVNPAFGGTERFTDLKAGYSYQWAGFNGAPRGFYLTAHSQLMKRMPYPRPLPLPGRSQDMIQPIPEPADLEESKLTGGLGLYITSESAGPQTVTEVSGSYSAHFGLTKDIKLGIGTNVGVLNYAFDPSSIYLIDNNDIAFTSSASSVWLITMNAGGLVYHPRWYGGIALRQVLQNKLLLDLSSTRQSALALHYYLMGGYKMDLAEDIVLIPSAMVRMVGGAPMSVEVGARAIYNNQFMAGLSYRHSEAANLLAGFRLNEQLSFAYSFEYPLTSISAQSAATHALSIGYRFTRPGYSISNKYFWQ